MEETRIKGTVLDNDGNQYEFIGDFTNIGDKDDIYYMLSDQHQIDYLEVRNSAGDLLSQNEIKDLDLYNAIEFKINEED
jgi:hypothetical protein